MVTCGKYADKEECGMYRILIIEDDFTMAEAMKNRLNHGAMKCVWYWIFQNVIHEFIEYDPHMVLIDIMLSRFFERFITGVARYGRFPIFR